jgi:hypothetical protein
MKLILFFSLLFASVAQAATLTPLAVPSAVPSAYPARVACIATSFNVNDSVNGTCQSQTASGSSGRGGHPTYTNLVYTASWGVNGNALTAGTYCGTFVVNVSSLHVWTYAAGFNAITCYLPTPGSTQISLYDPSLGFDVWFFYTTTSSNGAYALISEGVYGYIYGF